MWETVGNLLVGQKQNKKNVTERQRGITLYLLIGRVDDALVDRCHYRLADGAGQKVAWLDKC